MILIFGGAFQGKLDYARTRYDIKTVFDCRAGGAGPDPGAAALTDPGVAREPDFSCDAICGIEAFARACCAQGIEAADWFRERWDQWEDKVLILRDVSQGIVPMDAETRAFREMNGRLMLYLAGEAKQVDRVFCGIGMTIKGREQV